MAIPNGVGEALTFMDGIGLEVKAARLRYLRRRWMDAVAGALATLRLAPAPGPRGWRRGEPGPPGRKGAGRGRFQQVPHPSGIPW